MGSVSSNKKAVNTMATAAIPGITNRILEYVDQTMNK
jgi:hypothetical protein